MGLGGEQQITRPAVANYKTTQCWHSRCGVIIASKSCKARVRTNQAHAPHNGTAQLHYRLRHHNICSTKQRRRKKRLEPTYIHKQYCSIASDSPGEVASPTHSPVNIPVAMLTSHALLCSVENLTPKMMFTKARNRMSRRIAAYTMPRSTLRSADEVNVSHSPFLAKRVLWRTLLRGD